MKRVILRLSHHLYHEKNGVPFCAFRYFFALFAPLSPSPTYLSPFPLPPSPITLLPLFFYECARLAPYELYMSGHHPATVRRAGRKRGAIFESSEALAEQPAVARSAVELHRCCARVSRAAALVRQHIDGVARASSAGTKSESIARSLVLLTMLAPVSRTARFGDQLGLDDEAKSEIADGGDPTWAPASLSP